jgi:hypothetical protein
LAHTTQFQAPSCVQKSKEIIGKDAKTVNHGSLYLCRSAGEGKSMLLLRLGSYKFNKLIHMVFGLDSILNPPYN